jgi:hypothetical protein
MSPKLTVVTEGRALPDQTLSTRIRALQAEAKGLAREHIATLEAAMGEVERLAAEIAGGGEAYPAGVRDIARRVAEDCGLKVATIEAIAERT